jgi:two-component system, chemotaxis family, protein-glutamate methylesterase/glutaminase
MRISSSLSISHKIDQHATTVNKVVVIGASAGGISALMGIFTCLPSDLSASIIVVQHLRIDPMTRLPELLTRCNSLRKVYLAKDGMPLEPNMGYLAMPGQHLSIEDRHLVLSMEDPVNYVRPSIDVLFSSAAQAFGPNVIGVVLSGTGRDGANGCLAIKANGGVTIAQDKKTSLQFAMPKAAIDAGAVDYVLPLSEIAGKIVALTGS